MSVHYFFENVKNRCNYLKIKHLQVVSILYLILIDKFYHFFVFCIVFFSIKGRSYFDLIF